MFKTNEENAKKEKKMTKKILMITMIFLFVLTFSLGAAVNVTGKWEVTTKMKSGEKKNLLEFVQDGEKLTVFITKGKEGKKTEVEGTVKENKIEWAITRKNKSGTAIFKFTGTVNGDTMKGACVIERDQGKKGTRQWSAKRIK